MPDLNTGMEQNLFRVWISRLNTVYDTFESKLLDHVQGQLALGRTRKDFRS
jgi:hypothetical protein